MTIPMTKEEILKRFADVKMEFEFCSNNYICYKSTDLIVAIYGYKGRLYQNETIATLLDKIVDSHYELISTLPVNL